MLDHLRQSNLVRNDGEESQWILVEEKTALLYMSMLAQSLADLEFESTIPGTDDEHYRDLVYGALSKEDGFPCIQVYLQNVLPIPRSDIPLEDIVSFTRKRRDELLRYRQKLAGLYETISKANNKEEVTGSLTVFAEQQERELTS